MSQPPEPGAADADAETAALPTGSAAAASDHVPADRRAEAVAVLDRPIDDSDLHSRIRRPGLARSTRLLLLLLGAVVVFGLGTLVGRFTAPDTGPGSVPGLVGTVESVAPGASGTGQLTVRDAEGELTVLQTSSGTVVAVPRPTGLTGLRPGEQVTVTAERDPSGVISATRVDVPGR